MKYIVRAVKYFIFFGVLYWALVWVMSDFDAAVSWQMLMLNLKSENGVWLVAMMVALSLAYPFFGFMTRREVAYLVEDKPVVIDAFKKVGYVLKREDNGVLVFGAESTIKRAFLLFEDEITVEQNGQWIVVKGIRRMVARVAYYLQVLLERKRMGVEE
ncbi:MAG: hypothetical protein Q4F45_02800 [Alistipes sp.]|nr:hypothetical protein [Alistipes sp.]